MKETDFFIIVRSLFVCVHETRWIPGLSKLEMWVTSLSDTPHLQYYDVQTLECRYISKLPMKNERIWRQHPISKIN
jgi:hypothetical protein